ncbi:hypothetical protein [Mesorhizobium sp. BE184]|uniref:hypothetical protein n=1 Tax=Mesorhizobium sp. BE184 TaxID=2817714 RepID=UPI0028661AA2|nr:hypothetical protein [Mesorhizobium sp. BE184]MDR7033496.1 hypothetical protein [Mesorhizobium sp. BE184]
MNDLTHEMHTGCGWLWRWNIHVSTAKSQRSPSAYGQPSVGTQPLRSGATLIKPDRQHFHSD